MAEAIELEATPNTTEISNIVNHRSLLIRLQIVKSDLAANKKKKRIWRYWAIARLAYYIIILVPLITMPLNQKVLSTMFISW